MSNPHKGFKRRKLPVRKGSDAEAMLKEIESIFSTIPTQDGTPVSGIEFVDEDARTVEYVKFRKPKKGVKR